MTGFGFPSETRLLEGEGEISSSFRIFISEAVYDTSSAIKFQTIGLQSDEVVQKLGSC